MHLRRESIIVPAGTHEACQQFKRSPDAMVVLTWTLQGCAGTRSEGWGETLVQKEGLWQGRLRLRCPCVIQKPTTHPPVEEKSHSQRTLFIPSLQAALVSCLFASPRYVACVLVSQACSGVSWGLEVWSYAYQGRSSLLHRNRHKHNLKVDPQNKGLRIHAFLLCTSHSYWSEVFGENA